MANGISFFFPYIGSFGSVDHFPLKLDASCFARTIKILCVHRIYNVRYDYSNRNKPFLFENDNNNNINTKMPRINTKVYESFEQWLEYLFEIYENTHTYTSQNTVNVNSARTTEVLNKQKKMFFLWDSAIRIRSMLWMTLWTSFSHELESSHNLKI